MRIRYRESGSHLENVPALHFLLFLHSRREVQAVCRAILLTIGNDENLITDDDNIFHTAFHFCSTSLWLIGYSVIKSVEAIVFKFGICIMIGDLMPYGLQCSQVNDDCVAVLFS